MLCYTTNEETNVVIDCRRNWYNCSAILDPCHIGPVFQHITP